MLAAILLVALKMRRRAGDAAGVCLLGLGAAVYFTEIWRDQEGRGSFLAGALDGPQIAAIAFVLCGAATLMDRKPKKRSMEPLHG
jgi:phosphatidylglycerol:prolipoprotein diacylglycerol transferase